MKKLYITFLALLLALTMVLPAGVASADSPQIEVSGNVELVFDYDNFVVEKYVGVGVLICSMAHFVTYTGDLEGGAYETLDSMVNFNSTAFTSEGIQTFTGTLLVDGVPYAGGFTARVGHQGADAECKVVQTIISGTDDFTNLRGTFHFTVTQDTPDDPYTGSYYGKLHFAP